MNPFSVTQNMFISSMYIAEFSVSEMNFNLICTFNGFLVPSIFVLFCTFNRLPGSNRSAAMKQTLVAVAAASAES